MIKLYQNNNPKFREIFNDENGAYIRTGVLKDGKDTGVDPFMRSFPNLIDVGIMGSCIHGQSRLCQKSGVECYQSGKDIKKLDMSLENLEKICKECENKVYSIALGGRGDPNKHAQFHDILQCARKHGIVPNYTTSGLNLTDDEIKWTKGFCGAVATSFYFQPHTYSAIERFAKAGCTTNIHFVINNHTIQAAIDHLEKRSFPAGIHAVIFLLHKPVGLGSAANMIKVDDPRIEKFFSLIDGQTFSHQIGFDSCFVPGVKMFCKQVAEESIDACEGARYSMYISADMQATPCSFDQAGKWAVDLNKFTIQEAWNSPQFENFRERFKNLNEKFDFCGICPIVPDIALNKQFQNQRKL